VRSERVDRHLDYSINYCTGGPSNVKFSEGFSLGNYLLRVKVRKLHRVSYFVLHPAFAKYQKGHMLFSHPDDFNPVCTTETGKLVPSKTTEGNGLSYRYLSVDPVKSHEEWIFVMSSLIVRTLHLELLSNLWELVKSSEYELTLREFCVHAWHMRQRNDLQTTMVSFSHEKEATHDCHKLVKKTDKIFLQLVESSNQLIFSNCTSLFLLAASSIA
jgi:hypothetical protein